MRTVSYLAAGVVLGGAISSGGPLEKSAISNEAKWVAHLDMEAFNESQLGRYFLELGKKAIDEKKDMPVKLDVDVLIDDLKSVTAYGFEFQDQPEDNSAIMVKTGDRLRAIVDALILNMQMSGQENNDFQTIDGKAFPTYLLGNELYVSIISDTFFVGSKSFEQIEKAINVVDGKEASLEDDGSKLIHGDTEGFFFFTSAEGLNTIDGIPPQARMLQQATGAQFSLGEIDENLRTQLWLTTESSEVSDQLYRIIQGMLALISFAQIENEGLEAIVRNAEVRQGSDFVSVDLAYPAESILKIVRPLVEQGSKKKSHAHHSHTWHEKKDTSSVDIVVDDAIGGEELRVLNVDAKSDDGNFPRRSIDGDMSTYWAAQGRGQWVRYELSSPSLIRELKIAWTGGHYRQHRFTVQKSDNGRDWANVIDRISSGNTEDFESFNIPDTQASWIRIWCNANTRGPMNAISEIRFLGEANHEIPEGEESAEK